MACRDQKHPYACWGYDVTLDDVACFIDISVVGRLITEDDILYEDGKELLLTKLGFTEAESQCEVTI